MATIQNWFAPFESTALPFLASLAVWATLLPGAAWLVTARLKQASPAVRYCVWQFAVLGLLLVPLLFALVPGIPLGFWPVVAQPAETTAASPHSTIRAAVPSATNNLTPAGGEFPTRLPGDAHVPSAPVHTSDIAPYDGAPAREPQPHASHRTDMLHAEDAGERSANTIARLSTLALLVWATGAAVHLCLLAWSLIAVQRLVHRAHTCSNSRFLHALRALQQSLALGRRVQLLETTDICLPIVVGAFRSHILLPAACQAWSNERISMVLAHELAHVERRDVLWQLLARGASAVYWFHPFVWLAARQMRDQRERACDDRVLLSGVLAVDYAAGLVDVAAALGTRRLNLAAGIGMAHRSQLEDRVRAILDVSLARNPASARLRRGVLLATAGAVAVLALVRPFSPVVDGAEQPAAAAAQDEKSKSPPAPQSGAAQPAALAAQPAKSESTTVQSPAERQPGGPPDFDEKGNQRTKGSILVRTRDSAGQPLADVNIHVAVWTNDEPFKANRDYKTDADGQVTVKLPQTLYILRLWATKRGYVGTFRHWEHEPAARRKRVPEESTFEMPGGTVIGGVVVDEDDQPIVGATLKVSSQRNATLGESDNLKTDDGGRWKIESMPPGDDDTVRVIAAHPDFISLRSHYDMGREKPLPIQDLRAQTAKIVLKRGIHISGRLTDPAGKPVVGALAIFGDQPYWEHKPQQEVRSDDQGVYRLPPLPPGDVNVTIAAEGWMPERRKVKLAADTAAVDFALKPGKKLRLRFVDKAGSPLPKVGVRVQQWRGAESLYNDKHSNVLDSKIPRQADENGIYEWSWAPADAVKFRFDKKGFADAEVSMTADDSEQVFTMHPLLRFTGTVVDANTGQPIEAFAVVPIIHFRPDFPLVERQSTTQCNAGKFDLEFTRGDVEHSVQIEAPGCATQRVGPYAIGADVPQVELRLKPAARFVGRVLNEAGQGVAGARVYVGSYWEHLDLFDLDKSNGGDDMNYWVTTNDSGEFEIVHQLERYCLVVVSADGYAEADRAPGELPGPLTLRRWAKVNGRLVQAGKGVKDWSVRLDPIRESGGDAPRGAFGLHAKTADDGSFKFDRVPPVPCRVHGDLHWSVVGPLSSSHSLPIKPAPGEQMTVALGEGGAEVTGKLILDPPPAGDFDYHFGLNYLVARRLGIEAPPAIAAKGFDARHGWSDAWTSSQEGFAYLNTLHHHFVKPEADGRFRISGVAPGEYDLALRLYGSTEGCLVHPVGMAVVRVAVKKGQATLDLGTVKVPAIAGLKPGDAAPPLDFNAGLDGQRRAFADNTSGKYVLLDFWATWCGPCVAKIGAVENLRQKYADSLGLIVVGVNLDQDGQRALEFVRDRKLPWHHAFLGDWSSTDVPKRFAVSSVPTYVLIGPDGRIVAHESSLEAIAAQLEKAAADK